MRIACPVILVVGFGILRLLRFPPDLALDYLLQSVGEYFYRGGFCFGFSTAVVDGSCVVNAFFRNRYDRPCRGQIALRPAKGFFLTRPDFDSILFDIACEPGGFGVASVPISVPLKSQGKPQMFDVGASSQFPEGKGRTLRNQPGMVIRSNSKFGNAFHTGLAIAGALGGMIVLSSPASVTLTLPSDVAESLPENCEPMMQTLWKLGDSPPTAADLQTG